MTEQQMTDAGTHMRTMGLALDSDGGIWSYQGTHGMIKIAQASPRADLPGAMTTHGLAIDDDGGIWQYQGASGIVKIGQAGGALSPPINITPPVVTALSDMYPGRNVVASVGTWGNNPDSYTGQWLSNSIPIPGATQTTYVLQQSDVGHLISGRVTATNAGGSATALSNSIGPVLEEPPPVEPTDPPVNTVAPQLTLLAGIEVGDEVASSTGTWSNNPVSYGRQWRRGSTDIAGASGPSYVFVTNDLGALITCRVTAINLHGQASADSNAVGPIVEPPEPPIEPERPPPREIPSWVLTNQTLYPPADDPKPAYLARWVDPVFRTLMTRITGDPGTPVRNIPGTTWGRLSRHNYNSRQAWNADESLLYIIQNEDGETGARRLILDGMTYEPMFPVVSIPSGADTIWHRTDPDLMWYAGGTGGRQLGTWNPRTGQTQVVRDFGAEYSSMGFGPWKWDFDYNNDRVVLSANKGGERIGFYYEVSSNTKGPDIVASSLSAAAPGNTGISTIGISPLGNYIVWVFSPDIVVTTTLDGTVVHTLPSNFVSHGDMCIESSNFNEVIVGRVNSSSIGLGPSGRMARHRLRDGQFLVCQTHGGWCSHTSTRAIEVIGWEVGQRPRARWCLGDAVTGTTYPPYNGEIIQANLSGSATFRICHHHNEANADYDGQCHPSQSPDGLRSIFASSWGFDSDVSNVRRPVSCYVADFRSATQPNPPQNTAPPTLNYATGTGAVGSVIACNSGTWTGTGITYTRRWYSNNVLIRDAAGTSYTTREADIGNMIHASVTASVGGGVFGAVNSMPTNNKLGPITPVVEEQSRRKRS